MNGEEHVTPQGLEDILDNSIQNEEALNDVSKLESFLSAPGDELASSTPNVPYVPKEAIVAFIDILGTSALMSTITPSNATEVVDKILGIKAIFVSNFSELSKSFPESKLMVISDSYVISTNNEQDALKELLKMLAKSQLECLLQHGEILRGAIAAGDIIGGNKDSSVIIGPAFIKAHNLESKNVIFPRIVIDKALMDSLNISLDVLPILLDKDGLNYIDFTFHSDPDFKSLNLKIQKGFEQAKADIN